MFESGKISFERESTCWGIYSAVKKLKLLKTEECHSMATPKTLTSTILEL